MATVLKAAQGFQGLVDITGGVVGAHLKADFLGASGHHRVVQSRRQDAALAQMLHQCRSFVGVADHQRHHRMFTDDGFEPQVEQALFEVGGDGAQVLQ